MRLGFYTLLNISLPKLQIVKKTLVLLTLLISCPAFSQNISIEDVKKEAYKLFEEDEFTKAYKLYSQLVANYPKDPEYNFRLGVCMIYSESDKKKCLPFLNFANSKADETSKEVKFYLGKAYHINYFFDEAIKYYNEYITVGSSSKQKKLMVDREIMSCGYGKTLLSNLSDLEVKSKKQLNEADYFRSYDLKNIGGKLLIKPEAFRTAADKKKKEKSVVYLPRTADKVFFSSYGESTDSKDIYYAVKLANGEFAKPVKINDINTEYDEDYPFLHPNGKTLYFASKGFNGMGGYDIFKSNYIEATDSWTQPENLEFPINSPDDDYLYVTDSLEKIAYFSTGRQSPPGKIDVLKINTERKIIDILALKGTVVMDNAEQSLKSKITVKNMGNGEIVGVYEAEDNGNYLMDLPNGAKLLYTVETPDLKTQSERVDLPLATNSRPLKQTISYDEGILKIINYFDETPTDESYLQYLKLIEKKSKLDVNEVENKTETQVAVNTPTTPTLDETNETNTITPTEIDTNPQTNTDVATIKSITATNPKGVTNKDLIEIAKQDATESKNEAKQLMQDSWDAEEVGEQKKIEANKKINEGDEILKNTTAINNEEDKNEELEKGNRIKTEGENDLAVANKIISLANSLKEDASNKQQEAILNEQYANELEKVTISKNKDNKDALTKLEDLQKQIGQLANKENESENLYKSIKNDVDQKENEIAVIEKTNKSLDANIQDINTEIASNQIDLTNTKKKKETAILNAQIDSLKNEQINNEKQIAQNQTEIKKLTDELTALKDGLSLATKIRTETIAVAKTNSIEANTNNPAENSTAIGINATVANNNTQKITDKTLEDKYKDKIAITDNTNLQNIQESNKQLANYNKEIDAVIANNKKKLLKAKTPEGKQQITNEIKQLETFKKEYSQLIVTNNKQIQRLNQDVSKNNTSANANEKPINLNPITAKNGSEAIKNLDDLNNQLNANDNANFEFNAYQNTEAQKLKIEADSKINDAVVQKKKLKEVIATSKDEIKALDNTSSLSDLNPTQLNIEAEELFNQAQKLRTDAQSKAGAEKEKLLNEAKLLDEKGNDKNLKAADITKNDNSTVYTTNLENINTLLAENKSPETDVTEAKKLNDEAALAINQANLIREESNSLTNVAAILGGLSNAEEKEANAINKQEQALDLLKKSNSTADLKTAVTSTSSIKVVKEDGNVNSKLETVNAEINDLAAIKIDAYQKMYEANALEIEQINAGLITNENVILNTPSLKSESIASSNKLTSATVLKQKSDAATNANEKLNDLIDASKKQIETITQLTMLNKKVNTQIATDVVKNNTVKNNSATKDNTTKDNSFVKDNTTENNSVAKDNTTKDNSTSNENSTAKIINTKTVSVNELSKNDTTANQLVSYFENKGAPLKNTQANSLKNNAITGLKITDTEKKAIELEINNYKQQNPVSNETPTELKTKADALIIESEELSNKAAELKTKANNADGTEKDSLIALANGLDNSSTDKKLEASNLNQQSNEIDYKTNNNAIKELLERLKTDNSTLLSELEQKNSELITIKSQSQKLREEANAQINPNAKIGALSNVEEKEAEFLIKQNQLITELKKQYPDYVVKPLSSDDNVANVTLPSDLVQKQKQIQEKEASELTNLTNALSLEYETAKNYVPKNLTADEKIVKQNADELNAESKRLLINSTQEQNPNEKTKLLTLAAKTGNTANEQLSKITRDKVVANNTTKTNVKNNTNASANTNPKNNKNSSTNNTIEIPNENNITNPAVNNTKGTVKIEGLEVVSGYAYSAENPIPLDSKMPDGLVFRVQIGAFKNQLANDAFRGLSPLNGETVGNGYIRYIAGNFVKFENASAVKNDLRNLGYADAFVVAYFNGKRVTVAEAIALLNKEGKTIDNNAPTTAGITANSNVPKASTTVTQPNLNAQDLVIVTKELEQINGLLFTVQIGVYNRQVTKGQLKNLGPIFSEKLPSGLYRYTAGIYNDPERLLTDKRRVADNYIRDAFVSAYLNGKRISFADGKAEKANDVTVKLETQNPIIFPEGGATIVNTPAAAVKTPVENTTPAVTTPSVTPFTNGVTNYPAATTENGVKANEEGVSFKVQIGAYSKQIPNDVAARFSAIKTWPIENKQINGLFIYNIGNFTDAKFAKSLKEQAVSVGINDAFVTVYKDGKKVYGAEAATLLGR